jgi:hypothetical protein
MLHTQRSRAPPFKALVSRKALSRRSLNRACKALFFKALCGSWPHTMPFLTQCPKLGARPATTPTYIYITCICIYIYIGRQDGSGAGGRREAWRGGGCADWSGHGGGAVAGRERLPPLGLLCVCVYAALIQP